MGRRPERRELRIHRQGQQYLSRPVLRLEPGRVQGLPQQLLARAGVLRGRVRRRSIRINQDDHHTTTIEQAYASWTDAHRPADQLQQVGRCAEWRLVWFRRA